MRSSYLRTKACPDGGVLPSGAFAGVLCVIRSECYPDYGYDTASTVDNEEVCLEHHGTKKLK